MTSDVKKYHGNIMDVLVSKVPFKNQTLKSKFIIKLGEARLFNSLNTKRKTKQGSGNITFCLPNDTELKKLIEIKDLHTFRTYIRGNILKGLFNPTKYTFETVYSLNRGQEYPTEEIKKKIGKIFGLCKNGYIILDSKIFSDPKSEAFKESVTFSKEKINLMTGSGYCDLEGGADYDPSIDVYGGEEELLYEEKMKGGDISSFTKLFSASEKPKIEEKDYKFKILKDYTEKWPEIKFGPTSPKHYTTYLTMSLLGKMIKDKKFKYSNLYPILDDDYFVMGNLLIPPFKPPSFLENFIEPDFIKDWMKSQYYLTSDMSLLEPIPGLIGKIVKESQTNIIDDESKKTYGEIRNQLIEIVKRKFSEAKNMTEQVRIGQEILSFYKKILGDPNYKVKEVDALKSVVDTQVIPKIFLVVDVLKILLKRLKFLPDVQKIIVNWMEMGSSMNFDKFVHESFFSENPFFSPLSIQMMYTSGYGFKLFDIFNFPEKMSLNVPSIFTMTPGLATSVSEPENVIKFTFGEMEKEEDEKKEIEMSILKELESAASLEEPQVEGDIGIFSKIEETEN